jgi:hypothetical protein
MDVIIALNDRAGWTRTMIADWVERFEDRHPEGTLDGEPDDRRTRDFDEDEDDFAALCVH